MVAIFTVTEQVVRCLLREDRLKMLFKIGKTGGFNFSFGWIRFQLQKPLKCRFDFSIAAHMHIYLSTIYLSN